MNNAGFDPVVYRDLDAAARALLDHNDAAPLLRISALSLGFDDTNYSLPEFSDGLYFAVACTDYVQLFSRSASFGARRAQYRAALRREPRGTFAPFSLARGHPWTSTRRRTAAACAGRRRTAGTGRSPGGRPWCRPGCPCWCCPARWTR